MQKRAHSVPFVNLSNIFPLHQTYFKTICSFMHDFVNDLAPSNISELFRYSSEKHYQRLAISVLNIPEQNIRKILSQDWVQGSGIVIPSVFFLDLNINLNGIHRQLLNILMREYTYVDVYTLTDKFRKINHF